MARHTRRRAHSRKAKTHKRHHKSRRGGKKHHSKRNSKRHSRMHRGGKRHHRGGSMTSIMRTAALPATLFAANVLSRPEKRDSRRSRK